MSEYIINNESGKLELHFEKSDYMNLSDAMKSKIKSNFLFSRGRGAWVSRCKFPHLFYAESIAKELNLTNGGNVGERLTFAEQKAAEAERAERRAEYYDYKSGAAYNEGERLQKPINDMRGDIAFFTQPNINSSAGRAFSRRRDRMWSAWESGFESFKKSEYYAERAEKARENAKAATGNVTKDFALRRINDAEKTIKAQKRNIESYDKYLQRINAGEVLKRFNGEIMTADDVQKWIDDASAIIEINIEKAIYYHEIIDNAGGIQFSKDNIKVGYIVRVARFGSVEVVSAGPKNITYKILSGGASGCYLKASYAEILSVEKAEEKKTGDHPFKVGESYVVPIFGDNCRYNDVVYTIEKVTAKSVILKSETGETITRRAQFRDWDNTWILQINDSYRGIITKAAEGI